MLGTCGGNYCLEVGICRPEGRYQKMPNTMQNSKECGEFGKDKVNGDIHQNSLKQYSEEARKTWKGGK